MNYEFTFDSTLPVVVPGPADTSLSDTCFVELRHMRCFEAVARFLNFTKAAEHMYMGQPALSRTIMQLEEQLGCQLFARSGPNIKLTNAGRVLARQAEPLLKSWDAAIIATRQASLGMQGTLTIGVARATAIGDLPDLLLRFRNACPLIDIRLQEFSTDEICCQARTQETDICFYYSVSGYDSPGTKILEGEPMFVALPESHVLASQHSIALPMLKEENIIFSVAADLPGSEDAGKLHQRGAPRSRSTKYASDVLAALALVAAGFGLTIVIRPESLKRKGIKYIPLAPQYLYVAHLTAFWNHSKGSPVLSQFLQFLGLRKNGVSIASEDESSAFAIRPFESE